MKLIVFLFVLISIKTNCQLNNLNKFYSEELTEKHERNTGVYEVSVYKIKGKIYESDKNTFSYLGKDILYKNLTDDIIWTMIYKNRYLFVGHFPNTKEQRMMSIPYEVRSLNKLDVIDLEDKTKKWTYQFNEMTAMGLIKTFDPKDGDIIYCNHIKPEKNSTE
jgi:hypothetical protein